MRSNSIFLLLLLLVVSSASFAATYKWTDENGDVVYSQQPPKTGNYEVIKGLKRSVSSTSASSNTSGTKSDSKAKTASSSEEDIARREEIRKKNCEGARSNLEKLTIFRRFRNEDGTVTRMPEDERQKLMKEAEEQIRDFCN